MEKTPIKPPRGVKFTKETTGCGLLVSVIKTLDASETNEQRQKEKSKIEKEFKRSDQTLNELVSKHDGDLTKVMQLFGKVSAHVTVSREKIHTVKENLHACKQLLRCRREELKKLYMDAIQQKYVLEMLEQINDLRKVPSQVTAFTAKKYYMHAAKALTSAIALGEGPLREVEGLSELRQDLQTRRNQLYVKLLEELNKHLYQHSTSEALIAATSFQRQGSGRGSNYNNNLSFQRTTLRRSAERVEANTKVRKALLEMAQGFDIEKTEIVDDIELIDPDLNSTYFISIIVECFGMLNKVPESLESIKMQVQTELQKIVTKTTQHLIAQGPVVIDGTEHQLLVLLELIFRQFRLIADAHTMMLKNFGAVIQRYKLVTSKAFEMSDFWNQAQAVLQIVLTDYLDIQNVPTEDQPRTNFAEQNININTYFNRRKIQNKKTLFKFDKTSHNEAANEDSVREHRRNPSDMSVEDAIGLNTTVSSSLSSSDRKKKRSERATLVCPADPALIRTIYLPMMSYTHEMEAKMKSKSGQCALNNFISTFVRDTFLARGHNRSLQQTIESLSKNHDAWRAIVAPEEMKQLGLARPLLQSTVLVENRISKTRDLILDLPNYSEELLKMMCALLKTYRETCQAAYRGIVQPETEDKRIYSVAWLKDDDISRFLKTLPNWTDLKQTNMRSGSKQQRSIKAAGMYLPSEEESPAQVQQRNIREAEMLTSNLGEGGISQQEILSDVGVLKELAILQESMEWFSMRISEFANDLRKPIVNGMSGDFATPVVIKDGTIKVLTNLALEFDELANTCLLVLHLEVRVQCFHYLRPSSVPLKQAINEAILSKHQPNNAADSMEPDAKVLKLTRVLADMDEALGATLHPRKTKYIFEGLAHLASRILIMAANYMQDVVDQAAVQRMCRNAVALQQTLSSITASREVALDQARIYYEMLFMEPEDILTAIIEKGPQFTEMQYLHALQLICKSKGITDLNMLASYQQKLSELLGGRTNLGVTV